MNSIVGRLTTVADKKRMAGEAYPLEAEAVTYIEQQAARIAELETRVAEWKAIAKDMKRDAVLAKENEDGATAALASLRQRIDDAPVVAWVIRNAECDLKGWIPAKVWADGELQYPLISKEDLQQ